MRKTDDLDCARGILVTLMLALLFWLALLWLAKSL